MAHQIKTFKTNNSEIYVGNDVFVLLNEYLFSYEKSKIFLLVDENSLNFCATQLISKVKLLEKAEIIEIESGEENKTIDICYELWKTLADYKADRNALLINLGGGVITDLGGFVASTYKRGIDFINIPTTLLAQIDASVGGKVGVDLNGLKNMVGVFNEPNAVFVCPDFLKTLDKRQMLSGYAEALKHALIADVNYWNELKNGMLSDATFWMKMITTSIEIKNNIVLNDPKENGERKLLNFGHTIGHAVETFYLAGDELPLLHGEAVALGMICESYISQQINGLTNDELEEITSAITSFYKLPLIQTESYIELIELMKNDKKNKKTSLNFTLLNTIGSATINHEVDNNMIVSSLDFYNSVIKNN
ncbi:MAG TPA: 3-dehydroquinate synthase [Vicingus sp.]|nr:3-dehydroquinate synthase [Vicingus sp.]